MRIINLAKKVIFLIAIVIIVSCCVKHTEEDPCLRTKWHQAKELEIKLAVHMMPSNPLLPGGTSGSQSPVDFEKMMVYGTIQKVDCSEQQSGLNDLGDSYINKDADVPAPIDIQGAYWIGYVVYVYELVNDKDHLHINLTVKITMKDNQSYRCNISEEFIYSQIIQAPRGMYYYILLDIYSDTWVKV
jgi:hypothetical protein